MKNGFIEIEDIEFIISPSLKEIDFLNSAISKTAELVINNNEYHTYESGPNKIKGKWFYLSIVFFSGEIFSVNLRSFDPNKKNIYEANLTNFIDDEELTNNELLIKKKHDDWLFSYLGNKKPYSFLWGNIDSSFDKKSCSASIVFNYKNAK